MFFFVSAGSMEDVFGEGAAAVVPEQMDIDYGAHAGESDDEGGIGRPQQQISKITDGGDQTVLVTNEDEAFALEPVDVTAQGILFVCFVVFHIRFNIIL